LVPGARMFAFTTAALSMLWPADPTRYDAATLGNRQSLFFFSLGLLLATLSWRRPGQLWRACCAGAAFVLATLTYEAPLVLLVGTSMLAALTLRGVRRRLLMAIALGPVVVWSALNALVLAMTGGHTYQATMSITLDAGHLVKQITDGLSVLLVDAWLT